MNSGGAGNARGTAQVHVSCREDAGGTKLWVELDESRWEDASSLVEDRSSETGRITLFILVNSPDDGLPMTSNQGCVRVIQRR